MSDEQFIRPIGIGATASAGEMTQVIRPIGVEATATVAFPMFTSQGEAEQLDGAALDGRVPKTTVEQMARMDRLQDAITALRREQQLQADAVTRLEARSMSIRNERLKLTAAALDRISTSLFTVGVVAPLVLVRE